MKWNSWTGIVAGAALVLGGCTTPGGRPDHTASGALEGGAVGAAAGAMIGSTHGNSGEGALAGAAIGALAGGLIGHELDQQQQQRLHSQAPQTYARVDQGEPLSVDDIKALSKAGVGDEVILSQIRNTRSVYHLDTQQIIDLSSSGVSSRVIDAMINTPNTAPPPETAPAGSAPPPAPAETVVVAPGPEYVWIGGEWVWHDQWIWVGGHWIARPYPRACWISGGWVRYRHGWRHVPGHWR
jgi:outer membrane lipoprotein SlyB